MKKTVIAHEKLAVKMRMMRKIDPLEYARIRTTANVLNAGEISRQIVLHIVSQQHAVFAGE